MPNRRAVTRGGALEATILENLRQGHTIRAACAAAGVAVRTYYRFAERSQAHRHDREIAEQEAERRLVGRVLEAADGGSVKAAQWLLERRWPQVYGALQRIDAKVEQHHEMDVEILALAQRYSGLTDDEVAAEAKRLAWAVPADEQPGGVIAHQPGAGGEERTPNGGDAMPLLALASAATDEAPNGTPDRAEAAEAPSSGAEAPTRAGQPAEPQPPLQYRPPEPPVVCPHCNGAHQAGCPIAIETLRIDPADLRRVLGDPR